MQRFLSVISKTVIAISLLSFAAVYLPLAHSQAISMNGGSIQGTITDPSGAVIPNVTVIIANPATGYSHTLTTDSSGLYSLGPLNPGSYTISVTAANFAREVVTTVVQTGTVTSGNVKLVLGTQNETIEVNAGAVQVNTEQVGVAGVVTREQIDTLPINGRNILDIAQIQPGVILQSGQSFDPTKTGYSALAINGQNGRTTRILVDGQDISDETVGTTLFNVPSGAIGEFQLNRSTQDVSGSVTSTGQVLLATQSGTNRFHGDAFYNFQDARAGFANVNGRPAPFQRNQYGGYVGGYLIRDKLFFFGGAERLKQADSSPASNNAHFQAIINAFPTIPDPFHDTFSVARLDYNAPWGVHLFARATYSVNAGFGTSGLNPYSLYENQDNIPALVGGADFTTGKFTHSVRFGYIKFINALHDGTAALGSSIYNPSSLFGFPVELIGGIDAGGNENAPQKTFQSSKQFRYDGTWTKGSHNFKYGGEITRILEGGFAAFYGAGLVTDVSTNARFLLPTCATSTPVGPLTGTTCPDDPLYGYKPAEYIFGNGNGSFSERPNFGLAGGGQFSWRMAAYVGDTWKLNPSITIVAGLRWSVDTDRANQDVATPTCGTVDPSLQFAGCDSAHASTPLFDFYGPGQGLGQKTQQNYANFGPQAGFVYSPGSHKFAVRGGAGIYYENDLFNNGGNARTPVITAEGQYFAVGVSVYNSLNSINLPGFPSVSGLTNTGTPCSPSVAGCNSLAQIYAMPVAKATPIMNGLKTLYQAASKVNQPNSSYIGTGGGLAATNIYGGPYKTPYSIQVNGGVQYEVKKGLVVSADFIHNATLKVPITVDTNHVGAARYLNKLAAQNAIANTAAEFGCTATSASANIDCVIANGGTIDDFAGNGLDSGNSFLGGFSASANTDASGNPLTPATGAAFPGANPNVGVGDFILPVGKSAYDALQIVVQQQKSHPLPGLVSSNMQISYNLSRIVTNSSGGSNQFFAGSGAYNQDCVNCNFGRNGQDHTNQISISGSTTVKHGLQVGLVGHFFSAPPSTLTLSGITGTGIFLTDVDGDGTVSDLLPGTKPGSYMHQVSRRGLAGVINNYNTTQAGTVTPAGRALVDNGLFTQSQLVSLNAVKQALLPAPADPLGNAATRTFDASIKYPITYMKRFREGLVLTPGVTMYNVTNMSNYGGFSALAPASAAPTLSSGSANGDLNGPNNQTILNTARVNRGTGNGTFDQGGPRSTEFSLKLDF